MIGIRTRRALGTIVGCMLLPHVGSADDRVANSPHDLSAQGPGPVRAIHEDRICVFCHAPHNAHPGIPMWNRHLPTTHYRIYESSTTDARIDQPSGPSKQCLSCHDGSLALGLVLSRRSTDPIVLNRTFLPTGPANLTNDLSDDHPIGFRYDRALSNRDPQIRPPEIVSSRIPLGDHGVMQCTTCHDPHNNEFGNFLRITDRRGALCLTCHDMRGWPLSSHAIHPRSISGRRVDPSERLNYQTMTDNACITCHKIHHAEGRERLLRFRREEQNCLNCHDGSLASDIASVIDLRHGHSGKLTLGVHDPAERHLSMRPHVECVDCHNPHAARSSGLSGLRPRQPITVPGPLRHAGGVSLSGTSVRSARFYYEVCLRCHGDAPVPVDQRILRQVIQPNLRLRIAPTAASAHPITRRGRSNEVPSLLPEFRTRTLISCQDCHNSSNAKSVGGAGPEGPHGSVFSFLLARNYETADFTTESPNAYALCYQCHDRTSILGDESFPLHRVHVVNGRSPCSACHAPHGVPGSRTNHSHLINFDRTIVRGVSGAGRPEFIDNGRFSGNCTMTCHGVNHVRFGYQR